MERSLCADPAPMQPLCDEAPAAVARCQPGAVGPRTTSASSSKPGLPAAQPGGRGCSAVQSGDRAGLTCGMVRGGARWFTSFTGQLEIQHEPRSQIRRCSGFRFCPWLDQRVRCSAHPIARLRRRRGRGGLRRHRARRLFHSRAGAGRWLERWSLPTDRRLCGVQLARRAGRSHRCPGAIDGRADAHCRTRSQRQLYRHRSGAG